ncbi:MAG: FkbM family methyltransferase [bacterium]|nr:FkbM family methyltransferase [bacterium]
MKKFIKKLLGVDAYANFTPLNNLVNLGFIHGFYAIPENYLDSNSICYCIGAGIDISFDTELVVKYNSNVFIFDPMPEGKNHYNEVVNAVISQQPLVVGADQIEPFTYKINQSQLDKVKFIDIGIWDQETIVKFYEPTKENYASHSILNLQKSEHFIEAKVDRLSNIMKKLNHTQIDLIKIEIEGAEYKVIETIIEDKLDVKIILVEYDEMHNHKGYSFLWRIKKSTNLILNEGYKMVFTNDFYKRTFIRNDVYEELIN